MWPLDGRIVHTVWTLQCLCVPCAALGDAGGGRGRPSWARLVEVQEVGVAYHHQAVWTVRSLPRSRRECSVLTHSILACVNKGWIKERNNILLFLAPPTSYGSPGNVTKEYFEFADFFLKTYAVGMQQVRFLWTYGLSQLIWFSMRGSLTTRYRSLQGPHESWLPPHRSVLRKKAQLNLKSGIRIRFPVIRLLFCCYSLAITQI